MTTRTATAPSVSMIAEAVQYRMYMRGAVAAGHQGGSKDDACAAARRGCQLRQAADGFEPVTHAGQTDAGRIAAPRSEATAVIGDFNDERVALDANRDVHLGGARVFHDVVDRLFEGEIDLPPGLGTERTIAEAWLDMKAIPEAGRREVLLREPAGV